MTKTLRRLPRSYYWGLQCRDVEGPLDQSHAQLQQQPAGAPIERVTVDIMGNFPCSEQGNCHVLAAIDYFTKCPEAYAIPGRDVADVLVEGIFSWFGTAGTIHSDQGRNLGVCCHVRVPGCAENPHYPTTP